MKKMFLHMAVSAAVAGATALSAVAQTENRMPQWEQVNVNDSADIRDDVQNRDEVEIYTRDGVLYISVSKPVKIEIYSILGQLITSRQLKPGTVRLNLNRRGVYILKAGSLTRRINL